MLKKIEKEILEFWEKNQIPKKTRESKKNLKTFFFMDGPPYATGYIHIGTAWNKIIKDCFIRFWRMQGFNVWDQPGYDTHGTPIEVKVEKELGFHSKKDILDFGVKNFVEKCRHYATRFIGVMNDQFSNLGVWMNWENPYITLKNEYIEGAWFTFKKSFEKGLLYKGNYPVHVCPRCETVVAYNEIEYTKLTDPSIYVKFPVKGKNNEFLLIWTTTPWTLPANTGIMVHPDFEYAKVRVEDEILIIAKELVETVMKKAGIETYEIIETFKGKELEETKYESPLKHIVPIQRDLKNGHRVVLSRRFVSLEEGTGLVHSAPGHGLEDYKVGLEYNLPVLSPVNLNGTFTEDAGYWLKGKFTKAADNEIIDELEKKGFLFHKENVTHDYPQCWRCDSALLLISVPQWFFKITAVRDKLLSENKKVKWIPEWAGKRFENWLEGLGDWPISRQRYWGIPLPIWECECGRIEVIGSLKELKEKSNLEKEIDLHKPEIDEVKIKCKCGREMKRIPDVLDVWFDSGVSTWASLEYPNKKDLFEKMWPSDFQTEGPDQIRGWWNSQLITSVLTFDRAPYKTILFHGFVLDAHGAKMSKSRGNIVMPEDVVEKYGRDVLRFYLLSSAVWNDFYFNWEDVVDTNKMFNIFLNIHNFVKTYGENQEKPKNLKMEDKWILSKIYSLAKSSQKYGKNYEIHKVSQGAKDFILNDFSRWYIKIIRDRVSPWYDGEDKKAAQYTLLKVLNVLIKILAPITPFITEKIYQELYREKEGLESIHMCSWPEIKKNLINPKLENEMELIKNLIENVYSLRQEMRAKLKWPVSKIYIKPKNKELENAVNNLKEIVKIMGNFKEIELVKEMPKDLKSKEFPDGIIALGEVLKDEALVRELIRKVQILRKNEKLKVTEKIVLWLKTDKETENLLKKHEKMVLGGVGAEKIEFELKEEKGKLEFEGKEIKIGFKKK